MRLRNFFPKSFFNRMLLIILVPLLLIQFLTITVFYLRHWNTVTRHMSENLVADISVIISQIDPNEQNLTKNVKNIAQNLNLFVEWSPNEVFLDEILPATSYAEEKVRNAFRDKINLPLRTYFNFHEDYILLKTIVHGGLVSIKFNKKRVFSSTSWIFVSWSIASSLLLFAITLIFISGQVKTIKNLARIAYNLGLGREVKNINVSGATEIRLATRAFISMASRIRKQMSERTDMLAGISHDLRTPLTRLKLQMALLDKSPENKEMLNDINEMEKLISSYINFVKEEETEKLQLTDIQELIKLSVNEANRSNPNLIKYIIKPLPKINIKSQSIKRALDNILSNAKKFAKNCQVTAKIIDETIEIIVDDDGEGIDEIQRENVLKPFYRIENSRNKKTGGSGLGLSITNNILLSHGGNLELLDSPMGGLRVKAVIPI